MWLLCATLSLPASAATLHVGPNEAYRSPSTAIAAAHDGDTISLAPGIYVDCAVVRQNNLTIEGAAAGVLIADKPCQGKALLVTSGNNITIRNLTLQHARVPDRNGAGIRAEGGDLTIERTRFLDNENGLLSTSNPSATIRISDSAFIGNGTCEFACAHGIYAGEVKLLRIERTRFLDTHEGHHIKSRALRTEIVDCDITDGPNGNSSYLIDIPSGGSLLAISNHLQKGPHSENHGFAITLGEEGALHPTVEIRVANNVFANESGQPTVFVRNDTATKADLIGNALKGPDIRPLQGEGTVR